GRTWLGVGAGIGLKGGEQEILDSGAACSRTFDSIGFWRKAFRWTKCSYFPQRATKAWQLAPHFVSCVSAMALMHGLVIGGVSTVFISGATMASVSMSICAGSPELATIAGTLPSLLPNYLLRAGSAPSIPIGWSMDRVHSGRAASSPALSNPRSRRS